MPKLARDEDHVEPPGDEERGEGMAERVKREPPLALEPRGLDGGAVVAALAVGLAEDQVLGPLVGRGEPASPQESRHDRASTTPRRPPSVFRCVGARFRDS